VDVRRSCPSRLKKKKRNPRVRITSGMNRSGSPEIFETSGEFQTQVIVPEYKQAVEI